jgi:hypothetical protein
MAVFSSSFQSRVIHKLVNALQKIAARRGNDVLIYDRALRIYSTAASLMMLAALRSIEKCIVLAVLHESKTLFTLWLASGFRWPVRACQRWWRITAAIAFEMRSKSSSDLWKFVLAFWAGNWFFIYWYEFILSRHGTPGSAHRTRKFAYCNA